MVFKILILSDSKPLKKFARFADFNPRCLMLDFRFNVVQLVQAEIFCVDVFGDFGVKFGCDHDYQRPRRQKSVYHALRVILGFSSFTKGPTKEMTRAPLKHGK